MDAHDEFFSVWCEPEAWCERCEEFPAIHMIVQDGDTPPEQFVTYVRVWDTRIQDHVVLCRRCSKESDPTLKRPQPECIPAPQLTPRASQGAKAPDRKNRLWRHLRCWGTGLLLLLLGLMLRRKPVQPSTPVKPYSRIET
jgi:hypothetical protein